MTSRNVLILAVAAALAIAAGLWLAGRQAATTTTSGEARDALYPGLETELDSIRSLRIFKAGDVRAVELRKGEAGWTVSERAGYPADEAKLRELVRGIAEAKLFEEKTANPERYAALGVEDTSRKDAGSIRIELEGPSKPVNLIVGKPGIGADSRYVRRAGEAQSWMIDRRLEAPSSPEEWLRKEILDIAADRVQSATVTVKGEKSYTAAKESRDDPNFDVENLPKGKSLSSPAVAGSFGTALAGLTLSDVQAASAFESGKPADRAVFRTFDGLVIELDGWKRNDERFIAVRASFDDGQAKRFEEEKSGDVAKPEEQAASKTAATNAAEEAKTLAAKTQGWVYEIPAYRYESLFKPLEDLL